MANKVGPLIKEARTAAGLTQEQLAKKIKGIEATDISKAERGELELTQTVLKAIAKATGVTQSSLINAARESTYKAAKSAAKTTAKKPATAKKATAADTLKLTATEKKLVEAYRAADSDTKKTAMSILKGEPLDVPTILSSLMNKGDASADSDSGLLGSLLGGAASGADGNLLGTLLSGLGKK